MTQQPAVLDEHTQRMNSWFEESFNNCMARHINNINASFHDIEGMAEDIGQITGQQARKIFELLEIVGTLATGNDFLRGRVSQITREFKSQNQIDHKEFRAQQTRTIEQREEHSSVTRTVSLIDEILEN